MILHGWHNSFLQNSHILYGLPMISFDGTLETIFLKFKNIKSVFKSYHKFIKINHVIMNNCMINF
jgi:hypothetical protein